ncbi:TolC family protein [Sphingobacterium bambusae]|uniref:TolC family protein n=1 Tax=Sphingobacterium bambusae TaxID=662858 RepID=A0ABW6BGV3_9SPHI|nr:TolC family protein [Sphingobacterium bambusae]WPL47467.1 TolC family protein [Sphingobacterium bambusae]
MRFLLLVWVAAYFCNSCVYSQNKKNISLFECIDIAADSSLQAFIAKNYYQGGYWEYRAYKAARLPSLSFKTIPVQYNRSIVRRYDFIDNVDVYRVQQSLYSSGGAILSQNLDLTGGTFFVDSELGFIQNYGSNGNRQYNAVPIRIGYSQAIWGFNGFRWERKIAPLKFEKEKKLFLYRQQEIAENTVNYFFNYAQAQKEYELALENSLSADTLYSIGLERQKISAISGADVLALKLEKITAQNTLESVEIALKDAKFAFVTFLNLDRSKEYSLDLPKNIDEIIIPIDNALQYIQDNNPDYLGYQQEILEAESEVERSRKSIFDASVSASVGFNQVATNLSGAYYNPLRQDIVAVSVTVPVLDWGLRKGRINMAKSNLDVKRLSVQQKKQSIEQELISTVNFFYNQKRLLGSAHEVLSLANDAYQINKQRFIVGRTDMTTLTLSLNRYREAQRYYINSLTHYWTSYYKIKKMTLYDFKKRENLSVLLKSEITNF